MNFTPYAVLRILSYNQHHVFKSMQTIKNDFISLTCNWKFKYVHHIVYFDNAFIQIHQAFPYKTKQLLIEDFFKCCYLLHIYASTRPVHVGKKDTWKHDMKRESLNMFSVKSDTSRITCRNRNTFVILMCRVRNETGSIMQGFSLVCPKW